MAFKQHPVDLLDEKFHMFLWCVQAAATSPEKANTEEKARDHAVGDDSVWTSATSFAAHAGALWIERSPSQGECVFVYMCLCQM